MELCNTAAVKLPQLRKREPDLRSEAYDRFVQAPVIKMQNKQPQLIIMFIGILFITNNGSAQNYQTGIGPRFGGLTMGVTVKHFVSTTSALEGILGVGNRSLIVTGLYEKHSPVEHSRIFKFYYGGGGHIGFFQNGGSYYYNDHRLYSSSTVAGIDGVLGMEYSFKDAPVSIDLDFKPFIDFFNGSTVYFDGGISLRYTF